MPECAISLQRLVQKCFIQQLSLSLNVYLLVSSLLFQRSLGMRWFLWMNDFTTDQILPETSGPAYQSCLSGKWLLRIWNNILTLNYLVLACKHANTRLAVNRGSRLDFTPRPTLFFLPAGFCCLVSSIEETPSARLSKLENYGFDQLVSQRDWYHLLNEKSGFWGTCLSWRDVRGRIYEGCVGEVANRMSGGPFRGGRWGYLPFRHHDNRYSADWIRLYPGLSKNSEDGNSCSKSHKAARFDWSCGKSGQQWDWDYKPEYGYHHDETRCFGSEIWWFQRSEWTKRMSCGNFAAVRPKSHNNLILSFWLPVPAPWPRPSGFTTLRERCSEDSLAPFPHYRHYSPPPFNCLCNALYRH